MDLYDEPRNTPASYYEVVVLKEKDRNSFIQQVKQKAFGYMEQLTGWCSINKASIMIDLVFMLEPKTIVEIGVFGGKSLVPMAVALEAIGKGNIFGIDPWNSFESADGMEGVHLEWWGNLDHEKIMRDLQIKVVEFALLNQIFLIKTTSELAPTISNIDILHIDGNHSEKASYFDVNKWVPLVRKGGVIIFDDLDWPSNASAVRWLDENCTRFIELHEYNEWGIWIKS